MDNGYRVVTNLRLLKIVNGKVESEEIISVEGNEFVHRQNAISFFNKLEKILENLFKL
jgi:hypothetical protein